jgi:hypothetical protein
MGMGMGTLQTDGLATRGSYLLARHHPKQELTGQGKHVLRKTPITIKRWLGLWIGGDERIVRIR